MLGAGGALCSVGKSQQLCHSVSLVGKSSISSASLVLMEYTFPSLQPPGIVHCKLMNHMMMGWLEDIAIFKVVCLENPSFLLTLTTN